MEEGIDEGSLRLLRLAVQNLLNRSNDELRRSYAQRSRETFERVLDTLAHGTETQPGPSGAERADLMRLLQGLRSELMQLRSTSQPKDSERIVTLLHSIDGVCGSADHPEAPAGAQASSLPSVPELVVELAHDFRSPLTSILFLAEALRLEQSGEINELQRQQLGIIYSAALGLASLAGDIIELARGGTPLSDKNPSPFSAAQLLESVRDLVLPMAEARGVMLRTASPPRDRYFGHPVPLTRVLLNLTTNALQATDTGFVELVVSESHPGRIGFSVRDTGKGLDQTTREHLFEPLRTKGSDSRLGFVGSGLGLAICRKFVAAMGGELRYETRSGWGTRFFFDLELPYADAK